MVIVPGTPDTSVTVTAPAHADSLALLRTVVGAMATSMQLPLDVIEDLRLVIDEAVSFLLMTNGTASLVELRLDQRDGSLLTAVSTDPVAHPWPPPEYRSTLPWRIIAGLTDEASASRSKRGNPTITFVKRATNPGVG